MDLHSLLDEIKNVAKTTELLEKDIDYLANCYINEDTNFELPMYDVDCISCEPVIQISYEDLLKRVVQRIIEKNNTLYIDERNLMTYIDYYYQFVGSS